MKNGFRPNPSSLCLEMDKIKKIAFLGFPTGEKMKEVLLSGFSTHGYKSLNKAAGGDIDLECNPHRRKTVKIIF
jgi:hypothetical protein